MSTAGPDLQSRIAWPTPFYSRTWADHSGEGPGICSWCGIDYVQVGASSLNPSGSSGAPNGANRFCSPVLTGGRYTDYGNKYLDVTSIDIPPQDGLLVLFPSFLLHSGLPYRGQADRIVISFNSRSHLA